MPYFGKTGATRVGSRIAGLGATAIASVLVAAGAATNVARAAQAQHAAPMVIASGQALTAVSCPSASLCVTSTGAQELAFNPHRFSHPQPHALFAGRGLQIESLWCPAATLCAGIDFQSAASFSPAKFQARASVTRLESVAGEGLVSLRCPSHSECVTVDSFGGGMTYDPLTRKVVEPRINLAGNERLTALACPSVTQCTALDDNGGQITFQPQTGKRLGASRIDVAVGLNAPSGDSSNELDAISCPTTKLCAAADTLGNIVTFNPQSKAGAGVTLLSTLAAADPGNSLSSISCRRTGVCTAVDRHGNAVTGSAVSDMWRVEAVDAGHALNSVACPTRAECVAVDDAGNAFRLRTAAS